MDNVVKGFVRNIRSPMLTHAQVKAIHVREDGVSVIYQHKGKNREIHADYCLNCIPHHLLPGIDNNFPAEYLTALHKHANELSSHPVDWMPWNYQDALQKLTQPV